MFSDALLRYRILFWALTDDAWIVSRQSVQNRIKWRSEAIIARSIGVARRGAQPPPPIALKPMKNFLPKRLVVFSNRSKSGLWLDRRP